MLKEIVDLKNWVDSDDVICSDLNTKTAVCKVQEAVQYLKQECKTEKSDEMYMLMEQFFDAINILSESSAEAKASLVQTFCQLYLDSLLQNEAADFRHRLEILRSLNVLLEDAPCSVKEALLSSQFIKPSLKKLSTLLNEIGDYEFQVCISECLFRIIPKKMRDQTISIVFKNQARRKDFLAIRDNEFETDCRIFLNKLNASLKKSNRVFSVPCNKAWLGDKELHKPDDPNYETFWVDFNAGSERLTVFCGSYNSSEMSSEDMWETLTVWKDDVQSFNVKKIKEVKVVNILFSKMVSDIYPSQQDVSGRSVRLQFDADCHVENALESTFGSDRTIQKVSSASTPLVINKDESSQELQDEEIPCTPVSSVYRRKVSVPDVSMPILLSPTGSISSKISEPVSAIRINFSKTPSAYTSKSKEEKVFQTPTVPANKPKQRVKTPVVTVTPPSKSKKKTSTVQTAEVVGKRMNIALKDDKTLASNNRKSSLPELPIQSSNVDVESIPDSCPVEDGKSVSLETSQDVDARIGMSVQSVEEKDDEKYPLSSNEVVEIHTTHDEETSINSDEHINKKNTKKETQKELKQGFNLSVSKPEKTEYDTIYQVMNNEELHIDDTDDFQVLESFHEAQKRSTKNKTKNAVLLKEESQKIQTNKNKEKLLKLEHCEEKLSDIETNISIINNVQDKKSKINGKCRAADNQTKLEMTDNNYDTKKVEEKITVNAVTKEKGNDLVSPKPITINLDIDETESNFDHYDEIQVQESFPEPIKKSTKNKGKCQKKQKNSNKHKLLKDKHEQRDESDCDIYSNSGKENIDVNVIEIVTSKTKGTKKGGKEPKASSKQKKTRKVESKDGLSEAFEHATNSFVSVDLEDCLEKKNNELYEEIIESKNGEKASSKNKRIKSLLGKDPDLNKDLETSSSKLRHNRSRDNLTCFTSKDNSFTAEQLHSSWNEELPFSAPDIKKQAKYNKEETFNLPEMEEFDDDNMVHIEINDSTAVVKNNTLLNKFEEYDDYELVIEDGNKFPKQVEFVMPEKYKVLCNSNKKCKQIEKIESPDFEFSDQDDAVPCLVNKIEQDKPKLTSVDKTVKEPKGNKNRKKSGKDSHDSSDIGTKDTIKREQSKQKKKGIQKEKLNRKKSIDPEIIIEDEESDNDLKANSSYKFTCRKLPKCTVFEDSGINVDDETLKVTIPDSLTVDLPSNNEVEAKRQELNVEISDDDDDDDDERHKCKITPSVSKLYVAEKLHEDVEKDDSPVPSHILIENTNEVTKVRDTVNNRKVPISGKARTDRMSKIGKYALRKRNKEKLKEAFKVSDTEDEIYSTQSSNIDRVNEQLQLTPDNITSYTPSPDEITSYTPNNKDQSTTFEILENKDKTVSLFDKPKQYGPNKRKSDCAITQNRKFFHSNSLSQTKNSRHYTTTTVQKIDSSSCFGFESPRDDHRTDKSQNSKRSLLLLMSYSQSDTLLPCEKGDAGSDPYDFEAECNRQKGFKTSKVFRKKGVQNQNNNQ
ncbi:SYCP2 [Mytilus edulis]|uniref:SYCP2 n=1 Tax=Mytilus edulis TaxID=6550 RepID=A0A8S3R714_MYTED|nr:SYCP2 [Mytilus edulis]